jgi:putative endonuclease
MNEIQYFVYIMTNINHTILYAGVTNNLQRRSFEHRSGKGGRFSKNINYTNLFFHEDGNNINTAITREKEFKAGSRQKKIGLINTINPQWEDLFEKFSVNSIYDGNRCDLQMLRGDCFDQHQPLVSQ